MRAKRATGEPTARYLEQTLELGSMLIGNAANHQGWSDFASTESGQDMKIKWYGHACFRIEGDEIVIVTDPYTPEVAGLEAKPVEVSDPY